MSYRDLAEFYLRQDEGTRNRPYLDTEGKLSIGVGRNLDDVGVHDDEILLMFQNDLEEAERTARRLFPNFDDLSIVRKQVILNMSFNLGYTRYAGFRKFRAAVLAGDWKKASLEMMDSKWAGQVKGRATRLAYQMRSDKQ